MTPERKAELIKRLDGISEEPNPNLAAWRIAQVLEEVIKEL